MGRMLLTLVLALAAAPTAAEPLRIAFGSFAPVNDDIFIADASGADPRPLAPNPSLDVNPTFTPDQRWVVFTSYRKGSADLWRVRPDGHNLQRLTDNPAYEDQAAVSPEGRRIAYVSTRTGRAKIWILDLSSRLTRQLTRGEGGDFRPAWSPDGAWIAFSSDRDSKNPRRAFVLLHSTEIYVMRANGSRLRRLTHDEAFLGSPSWSPDGRTIYAYQATLDDVANITSPKRLRGSTQLVAIDVETGAKRVLTTGNAERFAPKALADGRIAYTRWGAKGGVKFLGGPPGASGVFEGAAWSRDGKMMAFHREVEAVAPPFQAWPTRARAFGLVRTGIFPSFSPDGRQLAANSGRAGQDHNEVFSAPTAGGYRTRLFTDEKLSALAPVWSPDGHAIAVGTGNFFIQTDPKARSQLSLVGVEDHAVRRITPPGGIDGFPSWAPDSRRLVFRRSAEQGRGLAIIDTATGDVQPLTDGSAIDNFPAWSPDGNWIAFTSFRDGDYEIYRIRPNGGDLQRLTAAPGNDAHPGWSSDGKWIAFSTARGGFKDEALLHHYNDQPYGEIAVMHADGTDVQVLTDDPYEEATVGFEPRPRP